MLDPPEVELMLSSAFLIARTAPKADFFHNQLI
jgi:hypothetical protein